MHTHPATAALAAAISLALAASPALAQNTAPAVSAAAAPASAASSAQAELPIPKEAPGVFKKVQGKVSVRSEQAAPRSVASGDALSLGQRVHAGKDAGASFTLSDGTEVMLGARSSVVLREYDYDSTTREGHILLDFIGGQLRVISGLISKQNPENLKVKTPTAVVGVRGTDFILEAAHVDE